jgi:hypothetical protein
MEEVSDNEEAEMSESVIGAGECGGLVDLEHRPHHSSQDASFAAVPFAGIPFAGIPFANLDLTNVARLVQLSRTDINRHSRAKGMRPGRQPGLPAEDAEASSYRREDVGPY